MQITTRHICNKGDFVDVQNDEIQCTLTSAEEVLNFAKHLREIAKDLVSGLGLLEGEGWYCTKCEKAVSDTEVSFEETHDDCGGECL